MNALIEILTEELPYSYIKIALDYLKKTFEDLLKKHNITSNIILKATPRRIVIYFENIKENPQEQETILVGPPVKAVEKNPKALEGFLKKFGASKENLKIQENPQGKKGVYYILVLKKKTKSFEEILKENFQKIVLSIPFPKKMKWDNSGILFARPIRNLLAILDNKLLDLKLGNIQATDYTFGHKIMAPNKIKISKADLKEFEKLLSKNFVVLDQENRKTFIKDVLKTFEEKGYKAISPENLVDEITYLTEYLFPIIGQFDKKYTRLPKELIYLVLKVHQRMFAFEKDKKVLPIFLGISNTKVQNEEVIKKGYEKVVRARLEDAYFYYKEDLKIPLSKRKELLKNILFHEKFGSLFDFINYLKIFEKEISPYIKNTKRDYDSVREKIHTLIDIYKNDLTTHLVDEFDELQGVIGKYYALEEGFEKEIADAIPEVYKDVPDTLLGAYLSLFDKIMALTGFFVIGEKIKGNYDPYGLRRLANSILNILVNPKFSLDLNLETLIDTALKVYKEAGFKFEDNLKEKILEFVKDRLKFRLLEEKYPYDLVLVVLEDNYPLKAYLKIKALSELTKKQEFKDLLLGFRRIFNILKNNRKYLEVSSPEPTTKYEKDLVEAVDSLEKDLKEYEENLNYEEIYKALASLKPKIDALFDNVMIMEKDPSLREKRLKTLGYVAKKLRKYGDFSKVGIKEEVK